MKYNHEKPNYKSVIGSDTIRQKGKIRYYLCPYHDTFWVESEASCRNCLMKDGVWAETFEVEEKNEDDFDKELFEQPIKPAYKSKGGEHGKRIIDKLVELGGEMPCGINMQGSNSKMYYYLNDNNIICRWETLPQGYTECFLEEEVDNTIIIQIPKGVGYKVEVI
jgi:hypothetical protein